jgi:hypothetical protein
MSDQTPSHLAYPLYGLYHLDTLEGYEGLSRQQIESFREEYTEELRSEIIQSLRWARSHPDVDLTQILPDLPFSNANIHFYASKVLASLENA